MEKESTDSVVRRDRFSGGPARAFLSSLSADERIFSADLAVDRAHVVMLAEQDVIDDETAGDILTALDAVAADGHASLPEAEDVHEAIETAVIDRIGAAGGRMHTARSRNDEVATCIRYRLREDLLEAIDATLAVRSSLVSLASGTDTVVMPGYTHLQPAQPITVAHWALSYEGTLRRDTDRLFDAYGRVNQSPLGAAAFAGTPFDVDRARTAELLGFDGVVENAMDAVSSRDVVLESMAAVATLATTLSNLAEDVIVYANRGFIHLSDDYASTSSIMPQKKNPDTLELVRAVTGDATAGFGGLQTTLKGLPRAYNRDLQRASTHVWEAIDAVTDALDVVAGAVATAEWDEETLSAAASEGFSTATGVADLLASAGVPFRVAHEVVAEAAHDAASGDGDDTPTYEALSAVAETVLDQPLDAYVEQGAVERALDPEASVASRDSVGGPAPDAVASQLESARSASAADEARLEARLATLEAAEDALGAEVRSYE